MQSYKDWQVTCWLDSWTARTRGEIILQWLSFIQLLKWKRETDYDYYYETTSQAYVFSNGQQVETEWKGVLYT